jgi:hypothetical protein
LIDSLIDKNEKIKIQKWCYHLSYTQKEGMKQKKKKIIKLLEIAFLR